MIVPVSMLSCSIANGIGLMRAKMFIKGLLGARLHIEEKKKQFSVILPGNNEMKKANFTLKLRKFFFILLNFFLHLYNKRKWSESSSEFEIEMLFKFAFKRLFLIVIRLFKCNLLTLVSKQLFTKRVQSGSL